MTAPLRHALTDVATGAGVYGDVDRAVGLARRRRRWYVAAPVLAFVATVAVTALVVPMLTRPAERAEPAAPGITLPVLPRDVTPPATAPPALPAGPVGRGALVYLWQGPEVTDPLATRASATVVVLADGTQYAARQEFTFFKDASLSPDGRWFGYREGESRYAIRDLTGTTVRRGRWTSVNAWAPDGRSVLVGDGGGSLLLDLGTGTTRRVATASDLAWEPFGVRPDGNLLGDRSIRVDRGAAPDPDPTRRLLQVRSPAGRTVADVTLDGRPVLRAGERLGSIVWVNRGGRLLCRVGTGRGGDADDPGAVVLFAPDGRASKRFPLRPRESVRGFAGDGILLTRTVSASATEITVLDPGDGRRFVVSRVGTGERIIVRGVRYGF